MKRRRSRSTSETEKLERRRKRRPKGKDPKVPVRQENKISRHATIFTRDSATRNLHAIIGTHQNAHTANEKLDANGGTRVCSSTQEKLVKSCGSATINVKLEETKRTELCIERRPRRDVLSTIHSEENRMATNKETVQSTLLSQCGKTLP